MKSYRNRGFTLVEILIVVIILGILAAIVIPQFTNASQDARKNSLTSQLQTLRSQLELYKLQHRDELPVVFQTDGLKTDWTGLTGRTDVLGAAGSDFGPYLQQAPVNPLNGSSSMFVGTVDYNADGSGNMPASPSAVAGFVLNRDTGKVWAVSARGGYIYNETDPSHTRNDQ